MFKTIYTPIMTIYTEAKCLIYKDQYLQHFNFFFDNEPILISQIDITVIEKHIQILMNDFLLF